MQIKRIFLLLVIALSLNSCLDLVDGDGNVKIETRKVTFFDKIEVHGNFEVILNHADKEKFKMAVDENLIKFIDIKVVNNTLKISSREHFGNAKSLKLFITFSKIKAINLFGAVELENEGQINAENLFIKVHGAGNIDLNLLANNLKMDMSGASAVAVNGKVKTAHLKISGAGSLDAKHLKTTNCNVVISGVGSATVFAKETLKVAISGAGSVQYKGNPKIEQDIKGAGSIQKL